MSLKNIGSVFHTTSFRLTLWYAVVFAASSLAVFLLVYVMLTSSIRQRTDRLLRSKADEFTSLYQSHGLKSLKAELAREAKSAGTDRVFFRLLSSRGEELAASDLGAWKDVGLSESAFKGLSEDRAAFETLRVPGHAHRARVLYARAGGGNILQLGQALKDDERLMQDYREVFAGLMAVMLALGAFVGWFMARRAMFGVERVTQSALRIGKGDFAHRVPLGNEGEEINRLAMAFNNMLERIQALVTELKEVTNNIAHDLRSPITRIRGSAEMTLTGDQNIQAYREMAGAVVEESDRLVSIINTMLEIAQTESGVAHLAMTQVDMVEVIRDAYELFEPLAEDKAILLETCIPPGPLIVLGDAPRLQRVMANLLDNAVKYTPVRGRVVVSANQTQSHVVVSIVDTGIGIDEKDLTRVFERFYRADRSRSTTGSGLGLCLARALVRAHGGEISLRSCRGKGSTFTVVLPRTSRPH